MVAVKERLATNKEKKGLIQKSVSARMSRRNSRIASSPSSPKNEDTSTEEDKAKDDKRGLRRNKLFRRIQMDIKVKFYIHKCLDL